MANLYHQSCGLSAASCLACCPTTAYDSWSEKKEERSRQKGGPPITLCCLRHLCCFHGENLHAKSQAGPTVAFFWKNQKATKLVSHIWKAVLLKDQSKINYQVSSGMNMHAGKWEEGAKKEKEAECIPNTARQIRISLAVDGDSLYIASSDGHIRLWPLDMAMDAQRAELSSSTVAVTNSSIKCVIATGNGLVSSHQDGKIRVWHAPRRNGSCGHLALRAVLPTAADCLRTFLFPGNYVEVRRHRKRTWVHHVDAVTALALALMFAADRWTVT
ncbi:F-box/WD repeat-containing protein sel-10-like [Panicum miliaceum]|uniref:F-box/WD repeat-containing protein sel-10-like n=1 Tax=Panicum miliaceum TaxID=4540 RepID=A0A3L6PA95_PANMI|nr:F-box/WD repeat-containing protein sel-10-like [Panicum miliaceum]